MGREARRLARHLRKDGQSVLNNEQFWGQHRRTVFDAVFGSILGIGRLGIRHGQDRLNVGAARLVDWTLVNRQAEDWARQYAYNLVSDTSGTLRNDLAAVVPDWVAGGGGLSGLVALVVPLVGDPKRAELIASTEATRVYAEGNELGWVAAGIKPAPKSDPKSALVTKPPAHPRCRCYTQPFRMPDGTMVIVWYTVRDERVCRQPLVVPWSGKKELGCRYLHGRVLSEGKYLGVKVRR